MLCGKMRKAKLLHYRGIKLKKIFPQWFPTCVQFRIICKLIRRKLPSLPNSLAKKPPKRTTSNRQLDFSLKSTFLMLRSRAFARLTDSYQMFYGKEEEEEEEATCWHNVVVVVRRRPLFPIMSLFTGRNGKGDLLWVSKRIIRHPSGKKAKLLLHLSRYLFQNGSLYF